MLQSLLDFSCRATLSCVRPSSRLRLPADCTTHLAVLVCTAFTLSCWLYCCTASCRQSLEELGARKNLLRDFEVLKQICNTPHEFERFVLGALADPKSTELRAEDEEGVIINVAEAVRDV